MGMPGLVLLLTLLAQVVTRGATERGVAHGTYVIVPGGACSSPTRIINITGGGFTSSVYSTQQVGQSFTVAADNTVLSHVIFNFNSLGAGASPLQVRLDDDTDMTSEYMEQVLLDTSGTGLKTFTFDAGSRPVLNTGTTYYLLVGTNTTNSSAIINQNGDTYANGTMWSALTTAWNAQTQTAGNDTDMEVWKCP